MNKKTQYLSRKIAKPRIEGEKTSSEVRNATVVVVTSGKGGVGSVWHYRRCS